MRGRYAATFLVATLLLTAGAVFSFVRISGQSPGDAADATALPTGDERAVRGVTASVMPAASEYARFAAEDRAWRAEHAREYTLAELRARGDGRRTPRQLMQDRVFSLEKSGRRADAIRELERWVRAHPRDADALLWLARELNEVGRTDDALARYRQVLKLKEGDE
jgi:tetratricopeptide (TPR) repeat protein